MIVQVHQESVPRGEVELSMFAWDRGDAPGNVELIVELDTGDLRSLGRRLKAHADQWVAEDAGYFEGDDMEGVPRPLSDDLFVTEPHLLNDYLRYDSFWHGDAGPALIEQIRGPSVERPRYLVTRFIAAKASVGGAQIVLGAVRSAER